MNDDECRNDCMAPKSFPKRPENRPGLSHIDYRIGTYADIREALLRRLNLDPVLINWTHREADDPGIALLEGASILGDILTFYQELYANEAYLRTAEWRESIGDLVRLLGYRLSPGLGGRATFAFEIKGTNPVVIPAGFSLKAQINGVEKQVDFETETGTVAYPHLSKFHLYRPRLIPPQPIRPGIATTHLEVKSADGLIDPMSINALDLKPGDRIMLIPDYTFFSVTGSRIEAQLNAQVLTITRIKRILDRMLIQFEGSLIEYYGSEVVAYRLGRSFHHFGHNAPALTTSFNNWNQTSRQTPTDYLRDIWDAHSPKYPGKDYYSCLDERDMPLDQLANDITIGNEIICQGLLVYFDNIIYSCLPFTLIKIITGIHSDSPKWGNMTGASTVLTLNSRLINNSDLREIYPEADIRRFLFHEVKGPQMILNAPTQWDSGSITADTEFNYWGTYQQALSLVGRKLILQKENGTSLEVTVTSTLDNFSAALRERDESHPWMWPVTLTFLAGSVSASFKLEDFDEEVPKVTVYGNLVQATQGKTEKQAVLGSGDSRELFQTFKLPKPPLTYFRFGEQIPPEVPELKVFVGGRLWMRAPFFFGHGPKEEIYIVREDSEGNSWVQFGDGKAGSRLPSGFQNVLASYRTGTGAFGPLKEGTTVQAGARLNHLQKIHLPGIVTGGDLPESGEKARQAAPGKVQSLGRLVSLQDFEAEALSIAGVATAKARWALSNNVPAVVITVLMESGREREYEEARSILIQADQDRGAKRFAIIVAPGHRQLVELDLVVGYDPSYQWHLLQKSIKEALGVSGGEDEGIDGSHGLFSSQNRRFGQPEYATRIKGAVQNIKGIAWVKVSIFRLKLGIIYHTDKIQCHEHSLLCLNAADCHLLPVSVSPTEVPLNG